MRISSYVVRGMTAIFISTFAPWASGSGGMELIHRPPDPYGSPRPGAEQRNVPLMTSFFLEVGLANSSTTDTLRVDSLAVSLQPHGGQAIQVLEPGSHFSAEFPGTISVAKGPEPDGRRKVTIYFDNLKGLSADTTYTLTVTERSARGSEPAHEVASYWFVTEPLPQTHSVVYSLDLTSKPVHWNGAFFTGITKPSFCTSSPARIPNYNLMKAVHRKYPKAWSQQRDWWISGTDFSTPLFWGGMPNVVRERETRRITAMERDPRGVRLRVEDVFGGEQYCIPKNRPVSADYHKGDEVLIADGENSTRTLVIEADDAPPSVLVEDFPTSDVKWRIDYLSPLPTKENRDAPGLFAAGGCYLRKFKPVGTPHYYWGRVDKESDVVHQRYGRRLHVNFADAPGDLSIDGRSWTTAKDYAELHEVTLAITSHMIERYGDAALDFYWSMLNEPDLSSVFWRVGSWDELQKFYDYSVDAILRAFEEHGYDSDRVKVGGLELAAAFGPHLRASEFLAHCSPSTVTVPGALPYNAAVADHRLDGKRSRRVENLCRRGNGKGTPCDFLSIHAYNGATMAAKKLILAKEMALEIDPEYYANLWVNTHEACPDWTPQTDVAAQDSYLGNGYFSTWCADFARRLLAKGVQDPRYAYGESLLTVWPFPPENFTGMNDIVRVINEDRNGDGAVDRKVTVPMQVFNFLTLLQSMGDDYFVLPSREFGGHVVSGFATKGEKEVRVLLYSHDEADIQSRSGQQFEVTLDIAGLRKGSARVQEWQIDKSENSYFDLARRLRDQASASVQPTQRMAYPSDVVRQVEKLAKLRVTRSGKEWVGGDGVLHLRVPVRANGVSFLAISGKPVR